ncbi:hypothetical protein BB559_000508 [Furculomyces boomerangus]|uniref:Biogenesis of lysosome-related organelles complex 1 subunit 1 n=2 Tax=Harpellales TaxID=61421 RepID=A0A2T9Z507_9FUNG|nr:hypothetical protein BB559_000508 [Furculomyces boomerangus]PVZ97681.1 hypothetical protein BB558_006359 [Smittium angustum]
MDPSLTDIVREHQNRQLKTKNDIECLKKEASESVKDLTEIITSSTSKKCMEILEQQTKLEMLSRECLSQTQSLDSQFKQWSVLANKLTDVVKELGDVQNWAVSIENEMLEISNTISQVVPRK